MFILILKKPLLFLATMELLFHGCYFANADETHKLIPSGDDCVLRTNTCFWKHPDDVDSRVKTRSMTKNKLDFDWRVINNYHKNKAKDNVVT